MKNTVMYMAANGPIGDIPLEIKWWTGRMDASNRPLREAGEMAIADWGEAHRNATQRIQTKHTHEDAHMKNTNLIPTHTSLETHQTHTQTQTQTRTTQTHPSPTQTTLTQQNSTHQTKTLYLPKNQPATQVLAPGPPDLQCQRNILQRPRGGRHVQETEDWESATERSRQQGNWQRERMERRERRGPPTTGDETKPRNGRHPSAGDTNAPIKPPCTEHLSQTITLPTPTHSTLTHPIPTHSNPTHPFQIPSNSLHPTPIHYTPTQPNPLHTTPILSILHVTHPTPTQLTTNNPISTQLTPTQPVPTQTHPELATLTHPPNTPSPNTPHPQIRPGTPSARRMGNIVELDTPAIRGGEAWHQSRILQPRKAHVIGHPARAQLEVTHIKSNRQDIILYHHLLSPPPATTSCHHLLPPPPTTTFGHHLLLPPHATTSCHHPLPSPLATTPCHHLWSPPLITFPCHHPSPTHLTTTPYHHLITPPLATIPCHHLLSPPPATTSGHHFLPPPPTIAICHHPLPPFLATSTTSHYHLLPPPPTTISCHGARAKRAREGGTNTLGGEVRQWNGILSMGEIRMEPIFYNPRIGGPWNDRIQEKEGWELEDRKKKNECHIIRSSKHRRDQATERLKKNSAIAEVGITHMTHLIKGVR